MTTRWTSFAQFLGSYACLLYATAEKEKAWLQTHLSSGLFLWFVLGRGLLQSLSLSLSFPLHHAHALQPHHIWIHPRGESHVNQTPLKQSTELIRWHIVNVHLWKFEIIFGVFGFFRAKIRASYLSRIDSANSWRHSQRCTARDHKFKRRWAHLNNGPWANSWHRMSEFIGAGVWIDDFNMSRARVTNSCGFHFYHRVRQLQRGKNANGSTMNLELTTDSCFTS